MNRFVLLFFASLAFVTFCFLGPELGKAQDQAATSLGAITYEDGGRQDPFLPLIGPDGEVKFSFDTTDILIEGIIYDPNQGSMVLIGDNFYQEGDHVGDANVISIYKNHVILEQESEQRTLWIREEILDPNQVKKTL